MKPLRTTKVSHFIGVLLLLGIVSESKVALAQTQINWSSSADSLQITGQQGQGFTVACPGNGTPASVWGTDVYASKSSICTAAVHRGVITLRAGGTVTIEIRDGQPSYRGSQRNGVLSLNNWAYGRSYVFVTTQPPRQANRPPNAPTLVNPSNTAPALNPSSIVFQWKSNGDPDGDPVSYFYIEVYQFNLTSQQWSLLYKNWVVGNGITLRRFQPGGYYAWRVFAVDIAKRSNPYYAASIWFAFATQTTQGR